MKKKVFVTFCLALLTLIGSAQNVVPQSQGTGEAAVAEVPEQTPQKKSDKGKSYSMVGLTYHHFNKKTNFYGIDLTFINPSNFGFELAYHCDFKEHSTHKVDVGPNYSFCLYDQDDFRVFLIPTIGPILRISEEYKRTEVTERTTYSLAFGTQTKTSKKDIYGKEVNFDGFFSARMAFAYKGCAVSAGYYMYSPKFKFKDKALSHAAVLSLSLFM